MSGGSRNLYIFFAVACLTGYVWLYFAATAEKSTRTSSPVEMCLIKHVTGIPCPSCGSTRSVVSLINGDIAGSIHNNPIGIFIAIVLVIFPPWILFDVTAKKQTLYAVYGRMEVFLRKRMVAIPLIILVLVNWVWNIAKGV